MKKEIIPKVIILDLDGVIIDSAPTVLKLLNQIRKERRMKSISLEKIMPYISYGGRQLVSYALNLSNDIEINDLLLRFRYSYMNTKTSKKILYPDVSEFLDKAKKNGIKLCICTNKPRNLTDKILKETNLNIYFDFIIAGGDVPFKKPNPENIYICLRRFGVTKEEIIYIGDSSIDENMATRAQVPFYFYSSGYNDGVNVKRAFFIFNKYKQLILHLKI